MIGHIIIINNPAVNECFIVHSHIKRSITVASKIIGKIRVDGYDLQTDINYLNSITQQPEEYDEFGQGYWKNLSLYNASGEASDTQYRNTERCVPTEHAAQCPSIQNLVQQNFEFDNLKMIRARSLVDGLVIPHRDFIELDKKITCCRVCVERYSINDWNI